MTPRKEALLRAHQEAKAQLLRLEALPPPRGSVRTRERRVSTMRTLRQNLDEFYKAYALELGREAK